MASESQNIYNECVVSLVAAAAAAPPHTLAPSLSVTSKDFWPLNEMDIGNWEGGTEGRRKEEGSRCRSRRPLNALSPPPQRRPPSFVRSVRGKKMSGGPTESDPN